MLKIFLRLFVLTLALGVAANAAPLMAGEDMLDDATRNIALDDMSSALAAKERGDITGAIKRFSYAITHGNLDDQNRAIAHNNRGNCYADLGDGEKAMVDYNLAINYDPNFSEAYFNRAGLFYSQGAYADALADYRKAAALNPALAQAHFNMSFAYVKLNQPDEAIKAVEHALSLSPDNQKYREQLAIWRNMANSK